ncbi:MAG: hypothetical protein ABI882_21905 [Acidobacteriota bacterium]
MTEMTELHRRTIQILLILIALSVAFSVAPAGDREFNLIARHLEAHCQLKRSGIPFLGVANLLAPITRPPGFRRLMVAFFEGPRVTELSERNGLADVIRGALNPAWRPLLRQHLRRTGEQTIVYFRSIGDGQELIIVEVRPSEATVMQVTIDSDRFARYVARPESMGRQLDADLPQQP